MPTKRKKGAGWEYVIKRAKLLDKPIYLTFPDEQQGDEYCRKLEALLDRGIIPTEYQPEKRVNDIHDLISNYTKDHAVAPKDTEILRTVDKHVGHILLNRIDANWVDGWITTMKQDLRLAPATIRAKVGAMARCVDWGTRKKLLLLPDMPFKTLPKGYAHYTETDVSVVGKKIVDDERDRRLEPGEYERIVDVIKEGVLPRKQRPLILDNPEALRDLFDLALESAMRLREMYTLSTAQSNVSVKTFFLDKTKNGSKRQVPMTSIALEIAERRVKEANGGLIFPWWDGDSSRYNLKLTSNYLSKLFSDIFEAAGCEDLHFHDLRHEATSRLYERTSLSDAKIMKITGHKSLKMMMRYANLRGSNLAQSLW